MSRQRFLPTLQIFSVFNLFSILGLCIWFQQRSATKQTWPNKWDNMVSGGLSVGFGIRETAIKEAAEEASVPEDLAQSMVSAGCVSFFFESDRGLFPNTEYVYDLELPLDFIPTNADGEVKLTHVKKLFSQFTFLAGSRI